MPIRHPWIKLKNSIGVDDFEAIDALGQLCARGDRISLKLELAYKLEDARNVAGNTGGIRDINEFMYFDGEKLIGYVGICGFGGAAMPLEITGMVHPEYRRQGVFSRLHALAMEECGRRNAADALGLCDKNSASGRGFLNSIGAEYRYAEFEMELRDELFSMDEARLRGVALRKAANADAAEVARQNRLYFSDKAADGAGDTPDLGALLPEDEEKRGMTIYLAERDGVTVGKVNLELINGDGAIYGLGVLPEYRGRGYGRAVLLHTIQKLKEGGAARVRLQVSARNDTALRLYESCGFRQTAVMEYHRLPTLR